MCIFTSYKHSPSNILYFYLAKQVENFPAFFELSCAKELICIYQQFKKPCKRDKNTLKKYIYFSEILISASVRPKQKALQ
jgi:hypothetical protein